MVTEEREGLRQIRRLRYWFWAPMFAFPPVIWIVTRFTQSSAVIMPLVILWIAALVRCASRVAFSHCPRCRNYYHTTAGTPSFWNLLARRCAHCGLPLRSDRVLYPGTS